MALPGEHDDVSRPGPFEGRDDGLAAIRDTEQVVAMALSRGLRAGADLFENRLAVLAAGILVGYDDNAATFPGDAAHHRPLLDIPLPRRAEDGDEAASTHPCQRRELIEHRLQRGRRMGVVDDDAEWLAAVDTVHPAGNAPKAGQARPNGLAG